MQTFTARQGSTEASEARAAIGDLRRQFGEESPALVLLFCSPRYQLEHLGAAIQEAFPGPVAACTTAGQIGPRGFQSAGITGVAFIGTGLKVRPHFIHPLEDLQARSLAIARQVRATDPGSPRFGLVLVDGLSMKEELLMASLHHALEGMALVGGSAGDDLAFQRTAVYFEGAFHSNAALLMVVDTTVPFRAFKFQHFVPTEKKLVATWAEPEHRRVREFNGKPAAQAYAEVLGIALPALDSRSFSANPLMLESGDDFFLRSIQRVMPDGSLAFHCAIDEAVVFTLGRAISPEQAANSAFAAIRETLGEPQAIIGCDCVLRRIELEDKGMLAELGAVFKRNRVVGFSTYGEQWNGMHVNQTFTGLAFGA